MRRLLWLISLAACALAQDYLRVQTPDGQNYVIDTKEIGDDLRPVNGEAGASKLPRWLYPQPDAVPVNSHYSVERGISDATFYTGGTEEQVSAYYVQVLRSQGLRVSEPMRNPKLGTQISGTNAAHTVSVHVAMAKNGSIEVRATEAVNQDRVRVANKQRHFESVWYDDPRGILRLRDTATGEEYDLPKSSIVSHNLNRPGGVASETVGMPAWLPVYPGAARSPKGKITWLFKPTAEFTTAAPIRQVFEYYKQALQSAGADIRSSGIVRSGTPLRDFSAEIKAFRGDDGVEIQIGEVIPILNPLAPSQPKRNGIGIRYTVPLR